MSCRPHSWGTVVVGSGSAIKQQAIRTAMPWLAEVRTDGSVESGVAPQPIGQKETAIGATNRCIGAFRNSLNAGTSSDVDAWIGIENGIWMGGESTEVGSSPSLASHPNDGDVDEGEQVDAAIIAIKTNKHQQQSEQQQQRTDDEIDYLIVSDRLPIPSVRPFARGPNGEWSELKDPHDVLTNGAKPRELWVAEAIQRWVADGAKEDH